METNFFIWGEPFAVDSIEQLSSEVLKNLYYACLEHKDFEIVNLAKISQTELLVVDCINPEIGSRNLAGIKVRERLAISLDPKMVAPPDIRALRIDFPNLLHLNVVPNGEPSSICLYFDSWQDVVRTWTPQKLLSRIKWWLCESAQGTLHRPDQALEQVYFSSNVEVILPSDFLEKVDESVDLVISGISVANVNQNQIIKTSYHNKSGSLASILFNNYGYSVLTLVLEPILHGYFNKYPETLGELHQQLLSREAPLVEKLKDKICSIFKSGIERKNVKDECLLILIIPLKREAESCPESLVTFGFLIKESIIDIGLELSILHYEARDNKYYAVKSLIGGDFFNSNGNWQKFVVIPVGIRQFLSKSFARRASGINVSTAEFSGVLAGVGALGSVMADLWSREAWGDWKFIDPDIIYPHNIVRHIGRSSSIGLSKAWAVKELLDSNFDLPHDQLDSKSIFSSVTNFENNTVNQALQEASIIIDASTTINVPRDLALINGIGRIVSTFLTPNGFNSVLLFEDQERSIRIDALEAQYYRAILNNEWGVNHLFDPTSPLRVGQGCRDLSFVLSYELVMLHASMLARQIRLLKDQNQAAIRVWHLKDESSLIKHEVPVNESKSQLIGSYQIQWDIGIEDKLFKLRNDFLPNETGGIIVGYTDHKLKKIIVVDVFPQPADSVGASDGFVRGREGMSDLLKLINKKTGNMVHYIGEWHSHPRNYTVHPSQLDMHLLEYLSDTLAQEGEPAIMIIVGDEGISITLMAD